MNDDSAPYLINGAHLGGEHGYGEAGVLDVSGHGKVANDIGSVWTNGGSRYVLLAIISINQLFVARTVENGTPVPMGTYVYSSGGGPGVNTASFFPSAVAPDVFYPMIMDRTIRVFVDYYEIINPDKGSFPYYNNATFIESYKILTREAVIDWYINNGPGGVIDMDGTNPLMQIDNAYSFDTEGNCTIYGNEEALEEVPVSFFYGLQAQLAGGQVFYIPKVASFTQDSYTYNYALVDAETTPATEVAIGSARTESGVNLPDRALSMNSDYGLAMGFAPVLDAEPTKRKTQMITGGRAALTIASFGKIYMRLLNKGVFNAQPGDKWAWIGYRNLFARAGQRTACYPVRTSHGDFLYVDWHGKNGVDNIPIPSDYVGRTFTVSEKSANVTVSVGTLASTHPATIAATGSYGYLVMAIDD